jgi:hypothetical protein
VWPSGLPPKASPPTHAPRSPPPPTRPPRSGLHQGKRPHRGGIAPGGFATTSPPPYASADHPPRTCLGSAAARTRADRRTALRRSGTCTQLATIRTPHHQRFRWSTARSSGCRASTARSAATAIVGALGPPVDGEHTQARIVGTAVHRPDERHSRYWHVGRRAPTGCGEMRWRSKRRSSSSRWSRTRRRCRGPRAHSDSRRPSGRGSTGWRRCLPTAGRMFGRSSACGWMVPSTSSAQRRRGRQGTSPLTHGARLRQELTRRTVFGLPGVAGMGEGQAASFSPTRWRF